MAACTRLVLGIDTRTPAEKRSNHLSALVGRLTAGPARTLLVVGRVGQQNLEIVLRSP